MLDTAHGLGARTPLLYPGPPVTHAYQHTLFFSFHCPWWQSTDCPPVALRQTTDWPQTDQRQSVFSRLRWSGGLGGVLPGKAGPEEARIADDNPLTITIRLCEPGHRLTTD